jgi:hypothetical protein
VSGHTPIPWDADTIARTVFSSTTEETIIIAHDWQGDAEQIANIKMIVRAVNNHDELVALATEAETFCNMVAANSVDYSGRDFSYDAGELAFKLRSAIAHAKNEG